MDETYKQVQGRMARLFNGLSVRAKHCIWQFEMDNDLKVNSVEELRDHINEGRINKKNTRNLGEVTYRHILEFLKIDCSVIDELNLEIKGLRAQIRRLEAQRSVSLSS